MLMQAERVQQDQRAQSGSMEFPSQDAPAVKSEGKSEGSGLPEGNNWRYSEFINAVQAGKVERVRFSKDGSLLQVMTPLRALLLHGLSPLQVTCASLGAVCIVVGRT